MLKLSEERKACDLNKVMSVLNPVDGSEAGIHRRHSKMRCIVCRSLLFQEYEMESFIWMIIRNIAKVWKIR